MATNGSALVEEARKHLAKLHKETGADVQKDLGQSWEKHGTGPDMSKQEAETQFTPKNAAMDMQKKKEDRLEAKSTVNAAQIKRDRTKKDYDDYVNSEEYRKKRTADIIAQQLAKDRDETQSFASTSDMTPPIPQDEKEMRLRAARDQAEKEYNEAEDKKRFEADMEVINGLSEEDRKRLEIYSASKYNDRELPEEYLVDSLLEDFGRERLDELERTYSRYKNAKRAEEVDAKAREFVSKRGGRGTLANILSVPVQAYSGIIGTGGQLAEMMIGTGGYKTMDPNAYGTIGQTLTGAIRGQTSENITEDMGDGFVGKAANIGYQGVMATADTIARGYLGGGAFGGATLAATGSFSQTMVDASKQGATPAQAALLATTTAALEAATEKIPLDRLIKQAGGGKQAVTTILKNALVQGGIEATTEEISLVGSLLLEAAVLREKSNYEQTVMVQIMQGKSPTEAREIAARQLWDEVINTALVSMISGGASSVTGSVKANIEADRQDVTPNATNSEGMKQELMQKLQEIERQKAEPTAEAPVVQNAEPVMDGQQALEQTNAVSKPLDSYPAEKQNMIRSYIQAVDEKIKGFVQRVKSGDNTFKREKIADVSDRAAKDIGNILGIDVSGYTHNINTNGVQHIINRHGGKAGGHDNTMALDDDIARVGWVLNNYDSVEPLVEKGEQVYSAEFSDRNNNPAPQIRFVKKIDGSYYVVEAACENKYKKLWVQSAYLQKDKGDVTQAPAEGPSANHETNARSALASPSPINRIAENGAEVNENSGNVASTQQEDTYTGVQTGASNVQEQSSEGGQVKGTGAAEQNFTGTAAYDDLLSDDNVQRPRSGDVRNVEVPKIDSQGRQVSEAAGNIMNSGWTPDAVTDTIKKMVMEGKASHDIISNETSLKNAAAAIKNEGGAYNSLQTIKEKAAEGWTSPEAVAKAELIYHYYANELAKQEENGSADETTKNLAADAFVTLAHLATNSGRSTQLFSVFRRMTPEGQIMAIEKNVQRYVDNINKNRSGKNKATVNTEAQKVQKPVTDAIKSARKESGNDAIKASGKVRYKGGKVTVEGNQHGEPFVFEYAQKVGEALAKGLENSQKPKSQKTFLQTMTSELRKFAAEKMPPSQKGKTMTATELLRDYIQNQDFYAEAWGAAQETLRQKHGDDPAFQEFMNSSIGVDANANPKNKILSKALAAAAMETGETTEVLRKQQALGITGMADTIANKLIQDTGATGEMAQTIRDAAKEFVNSRVSEADSKKDAKTYDPGHFVNEAMRDIQKTMSEVAKQNTKGRESAKQAVINALTKKYGFGQADASHVSEVVGESFDRKAQEQARKILEQKFGERSQKKPISAGDLIEVYANLGAYDSESKYSEKATESFIRAAMQDIGKTISDLAKSSKADRAAVKAQISQMITQRHGIDKVNADHIAEVVGERLIAMVEGRAKQILDQKFATKPKSVKKTAMQMMTEFANLGAFDTGSEYNERATAKVIGDKFNATIREDLVQNFMKAKTDEDKAKAMDEIYKDVASQITPTLEEGWDAWRNLAMLFNPKTHERNFLATGAFKPYVAIKRNVGAIIESRFVDQENRTKAILGIDKKSRDLVKWAKSDAKSKATREAFKNYGSNGNEAARAIQEYRKMLPGPIDSLAKFNMNLMEAEDTVWKRSEYTATLASFLKARGYTAQQAMNGQVPTNVVNEGRQLAINEAMKATFADRNRFSDAMSKLRVNGNDGWSKAINTLSKGVFSYLKTPANIVVRVKEYSPFEIARGFKTLATKVKTGEATIAQGIDQIASGLTGTGMMILGAALRSGLIPGVRLVGKVEDEDEKRAGAQDYSIKVGNTYYGIGWIAPSCIPLFIGAALQEHFPSWGDFWESNAWEKADALASIGSATLDPMLELSVLSSLNSVVESYSNAETPGQGIMAATITAATNYFTQGLPTITGQAEQATETEKTTTFVNTDNPTEKIFKTVVSNASQRIPGADLYRTTKLDEWGQPVKVEGDGYERFMSAFLTPFTVSKTKNDPLGQEIARLNKAQEADVTPPYAAKMVTYTDKDGNRHKDQRLTEEQYQTLAQTQGQTAKRILNAMIQSDAYAALSDEQKANAINLAYSYAKETGEMETFPDSLGYSQTWMMEIKKDKEADYILNRVGNAMLSGAMGKLDVAWDNNYSEANQKSLAEQLAKEFDSYSKMPASTKKAIKAEATGTTAKYIEAREKGISHEDVINVVRNINNVKGTGKVSKDTGKHTVRDIDKREAIAQTPGLTAKEIDTMMQVYMPDYDPNDDSPETTEFKYQYAREELGLSPNEYATTYRAYLDADRKAQKIQAIRDLGYDYRMAQSLYKLFYGSMKQKLIDMYG